MVLDAPVDGRLAQAHALADLRQPDDPALRLGVHAASRTVPTSWSSIQNGVIFGGKDVGAVLRLMNTSAVSMS
ncbi:hypothetical protein D3C85_1803650 [compost metagenome]